MPSIIIRHVSGTKANQVEELPLQGFREVLIGREANANVRFDADREDLVSRNHARIVRDPADPNGFLLMDLDSRNGTFINRQRIYGASRLQHGDRVQLGPSGPEFTFELDPPPAVRATRLADSAAIPPTREAGVPIATGGPAMPPGMVETGQGTTPRPVGRATVERMLGEVSSQMKGESRKTMWAAVIGILVVLAAGTGYFLWQRHVTEIESANAAAARAHINDAIQAELENEKVLKAKIDILARGGSPEAKKQVADLTAQLADEQKKRKEEEVKLAELGKTGTGIKPTGGGGTVPPVLKELTPEQIHAANAKAVILIEATWKITDTETGAQIYMFHLQNSKPYCPEVGKSDYLPVFVEDAGKLSPVLSTLSNDGHNAPIVSAHSGSGFTVGSEGFFLTNRHVLAPWRSGWSTAEFVKAPLGIKVKNGSIVGCISPSQFPSAWVPAEGSKYVVDQNDADKIAVSGRLEASPLHTNVQGEAVFNVTIAKTMQRYRATSVTLSDKHDVALGKVDLPGGGQPVTLFTDESAIQPGQEVVVLGYPAVSPSVFGVDVSRDMFTSRSHVAAIADPTLTHGPISKVITAGGGTVADGTISEGEVYQLGINTTGAGNSGGPVFDKYGRVIGIFYAGSSRGGAAVTYAVPVRFGEELLRNPPAIK
jgi:S1-C subfamily serine protease